MLHVVKDSFEAFPNEGHRRDLDTWVSDMLALASKPQQLSSQEKQPDVLALRGTIRVAEKGRAAFVALATLSEGVSTLADKGADDMPEVEQHVVRATSAVDAFAATMKAHESLALETNIYPLLREAAAGVKNACKELLEGGDSKLREATTSLHEARKAALEKFKADLDDVKGGRPSKKSWCDGLPAGGKALGWAKFKLHVETTLGASEVCVRLHELVTTGLKAPVVKQPPSQPPASQSTSCLVR